MEKESDRLADEIQKSKALLEELNVLDSRISQLRQELEALRALGAVGFQAN